MTLRRGDVFRHELPGAGGWGDPLLRDTALVAKDLRDGLVTVEGAARDYGVVAARRSAGDRRGSDRRVARPKARRMSLRVGIDIGGTFTDLVAIAADGRVLTRKAASTPHDYGEGIVAGLDRAAR